jgi:hypothetical protein
MHLCNAKTQTRGSRSIPVWRELTEFQMSFPAVVLGRGFGI